MECRRSATGAQRERERILSDETCSCSGHYKLSASLITERAYLPLSLLIDIVDVLAIMAVETICPGTIYLDS